MGLAGGGSQGKGNRIKPGFFFRGVFLHAAKVESLCDLTYGSGG
jgi:hypothetical protein